MINFYRTMINDLKRSERIIRSRQVKIPVMITLEVDVNALDKSKTIDIAYKKFYNDWKAIVLKFLKSSLSKEIFLNFEFKFNGIKSSEIGHKISYSILLDSALANLKKTSAKNLEKDRFGLFKTSIKDLQEAFLTQDVNNNLFEDGSQIPDIENEK